MRPEGLSAPAGSRSGPSRRVLLAAFVGATVGACGGGSPVTTFDLTAPRPGPRFGGAPRGQIVVADPAAIQTLEADRILVKDVSGTVSYLSGAQWADRLPKLIQARLINTFENSSKLRAVSRPGERVSPDYMLTTEIRAFQIATPAAEAFVELSARLVHDRSGRIAGGRVFSARVPVARVDAAHAVHGLDAALSKVLLDIVRWVSSGR
jgi:cholesterol transport system auxiliary component